MAGAIKRPKGMPEPDGIAPNDDPYPCGGCGRGIHHGQPYWGGGVDYFGEALEVYCERCAISDHVAAEKMVDAYEREIGFRK